MSSLHIKNGRVISPDINGEESLDSIMDIFINNGVIDDTPSEKIDLVIDAEGLWVVPGFIDLHVHLREPGFEHKETIFTGLKAAAKGGFTSVVAMPNTNPCMDTCEVIKEIINKADSYEGTTLYPSSAITVNREGKKIVKMSKIAEECCVKVFTDDGDGVSDNEIMKNAFIQSQKYGLIIAQHSEFIDISQKASIHNGEISKKLNVSGQPIESEDNMVKRDIDLLREFGGHLHVSHISSEKAIGYVKRAKDEGLNVTAEVTPHHLLLSDNDVETFGTMAKVAPPLRPWKHVEACRKALAEGIIDIIATDHAPHTVEDKAKNIEDAAFGMAGLEIAVSLVLKLVKDNTITPLRMVEAMSTLPAKILGLKNTGAILRGNIADITIINVNDPHIIDSAEFESKGKNTPFAGSEVPGRIIYTIKNGKIIYQYK